MQDGECVSRGSIWSLTGGRCVYRETMGCDIAKGNESGFVGKVFYVEGESTDFMIRVQCPSFPGVG